MRLEPPSVSPPHLCCRQSVASCYWSAGLHAQGQWLVVERENAHRGILRRIANQQRNQH
jgi:hypothetical protein